jgi:hypothetical protein
MLLEHDRPDPLAVQVVPGKPVRIASQSAPAQVNRSANSRPGPQSVKVPLTVVMPNEGSPKMCQACHSTRYEND